MEKDSRDSTRIVDVGDKPVTARRAVAHGRIRLETAVFERVRDGAVPKGDPLALARIAGLQAAKRTPEWLPLCHPVGFDAAEVSAKLDEASRSVEITAEVKGAARTGYEMEALTAVSAALLCVYDMTKALGPGAVIEGVSLVEKDGGKSGRWTAAPADRSMLSDVRVAVLTVSDRVSGGAAVDESGPAAARWLERAGARVVVSRVVPDDRALLVTTFRELAAQASLVVATGGTGFGPRDVTPEALEEVCDRLIPGFGEKLRADGRAKTPFAFLSRSSAGLCGRSLVVALPGRPAAVEEGLDALGTLLPHALQIAAGGDHPRRAR